MPVLRRRSIWPACLAMLLVPATAHATRYMRAKIQSFTVMGGKAVFVPPSGGFTVLDARTGTVLFRDPGRWDESDGRESSLTTQGIVVKSFRTGLIAGLFGLYTNVYRMVDLRQRKIAWEVESWAGCHVARDHLICAEGQGLLALLGFRKPQARLTSRRLSDGAVVWTYDKGGARGEILDGKGRLMLTAEHEEWRWREHSAGYKSFTPSRHVRSVTLLDVETGKELLAQHGLTVEVGGVPYGANPISFDGERVVLNMPNPANPACEGQLQRVLTVNASATGFLSSDVCAPPMASAASRVRVTEGGSVPIADGVLEIGADDVGGVLAFRSERASWRVRKPHGSVEGAWDGSGALFLESQLGAAGTLDAIDLGSGRPLWRHVYPATWRLGSTSGFIPRSTYLIQALEAQRREWEEVRARPFEPLVLLDASGGASTDPAAPVVLDPEPYASASRPRITIWASLALPLAAVLLLRRWKRPLPAGTIRRALFGIGLALYLGAWLAGGGGIDQFATWACKLAFLLALALALAEALRVTTRRVTWLARLSLALLVLAIGLGGLPLLFLA